MIRKIVRYCFRKQYRISTKDVYLNENYSYSCEKRIIRCLSDKKKKLCATSAWKYLDELSK